MTEAAPRVWLEIDMQAVRRNFETVRQLAAPLKVMTVLKADAYGLGIKKVAPELVKAGADAIGVAELQEALDVLDLGVPVHILGGLLPQEIAAVVRHEIIAPITDLQTAQLLSNEAVRQQKKVTCHFLIDTGMGRLGVHREYKELIKSAVALPNLECTGLYSHFPVAYEDQEFSQLQLDMFTKLVHDLQSEGITISELHIANSDGINNIPEARKAPFTMVRTGINLYGVHELSGQISCKLEPAMSLKSRLVAVREMDEGTTIGYGRTYRLPKKSLIGTVCAGYADGVPLSASNRGWVIINNRLCPILGRVSMDYVTVQLDTCPEAKPGDAVTLIGKSDDYSITVEEWAQQMGSIPYQVICSFGNRVRRVYKR